MPPADVAVRLAKALNVTVEYLVTGERSPETSNNETTKLKIEHELEKCSEATRQFLSTTIHLFAEFEKQK